MGSLGSGLLMLGIGSFLLNLFNFEFKLLMWIDMWGHSTGNLIRIGMIAAGLLILGVSFLIQKNKATDSTE